jgi:hypothetical protein
MKPRLLAVAFLLLSALAYGQVSDIVDVSLTRHSDFAGAFSSLPECNGLNLVDGIDWTKPPESRIFVSFAISSLDRPHLASALITGQGKTLFLTGRTPESVVRKVCLVARGKGGHVQ